MLEKCQPHGDAPATHTVWWNCHHVSTGAITSRFKAPAGPMQCPLSRWTQHSRVAPIEQSSLGQSTTSLANIDSYLQTQQLPLLPSQAEHGHYPRIGYDTLCDSPMTRWTASCTSLLDRRKPHVHEYLTGHRSSRYSIPRRLPN